MRARERAKEWERERKRESKGVYKCTLSLVTIFSMKKKKDDLAVFLFDLARIVI